VPNRPLLVTADEWLLDHLLEVTARLGLDPDVAADAPTARPRWPEAPAVVVDARLVGSCAEAGLPRRAGVVVVQPDAVGELGPEWWRGSLRLGAEEVLRLPDAHGWLLRWLQDQVVDPELAAAASRVLTVAGTPGGAGASTLAGALGMVAHRSGLATVLVDADPWGGGIDLLLGAETAPGIRWPDLADTTGRLARGSVVPALPSADGLPVLAWGRGRPTDVAQDVFGSVLAGVRRGGDLVVVDLGRSSPFTEVVLGLTDDLVLVALPRLRAVAAAGQLLAAAAAGRECLTGQAPTLAPRLVVRSDGRDQLDPLDLAEALGTPLVGSVPRDRRRHEDEELGVPPGLARRGGLARLCRRLLAGPDHRRAA
jgi:secretion/DNA translocation related CpaE-like protein